MRQEIGDIQIIERFIQSVTEEGDGCLQGARSTLSTSRREAREARDR